MQNNAVGWFEIPVTDMDRAEQFYQDLFDITLERQVEENGNVMSWFPMDQEGYGSAGTLIKGQAYKPSEYGVIVYFTAPGNSMSVAVAKTEKLGISFLTPVVSIGEHGFIAHLKDSEGNRIAIHSVKE